MPKDQTPPNNPGKGPGHSGDLSPQGDVPGVRGGAISQDMGSEPLESGTAGDEGGAGAYPGSPTFSETSADTDSEDEPDAPLPVMPTEEICGRPMEPPD
ncbi:hypothetical protein [Polyangium aurulentum]|uniref:hypothetical protein n=1 Tax=Polyangium aurulentum TaxID=2567896 RepID=UPI0010AE7E06|nr:hypothetical protein [Polyangium aurulentum]UQA58285.1 hypothetical protein E8A73_044745 [Polyangium aurulentum]